MSETTTAAVETARHFLEAGYAKNAIPLRPGGKVPADQNWPNRRYSREELIERVKKGANLGLRLGGFVVIDVEDSDVADDISSYIQTRHPDAPVRSRPGSRSKAFLYSGASKNIDPLKILRPPGIDGDHALLVEVLTGHGRQLHVAGPRADKGGVQLQWSDTPSVIDLPVLSQEDIDAMGAHIVDLLRSRGIDAQLVRSARPSSFSSVDANPERMSEAMLRRAIANIPNDGAFAAREDWLKMLYAIWGCSGGSDWGRDIAMEWSYSVDQTPGEPERVWASINPETCRAGAGYIRQQLALRGHTDLHDEARAQSLAELFGDDLPPLGDKEGAPPTRRPKNNWDILGERFRELATARDEPGQALSCAEQIDSFGFLSLGDAAPFIEPRICDTAVRGEVTLMIAPPGGGKSTLALALATALAYDRPDLIGEKTLDWTGDVVIVSNEESASKIRAQLTAYRQFHGLPARPINAVRILPAPLSIMRSTSVGTEPSDEFLNFLRQLTALRREHPIAAVIIDTVAATMGAGDENSAADMQPYADIVVGIARSAFCGLYLIHHVRKSAGVDGGALNMFAARGSGALPGSARSVCGLAPFTARDAELYHLTPNDARRHVLLRDLKHDVFAPSAFRFELQNVPAVDPRRPEDFVLRSTAILVPVPKPEAHGDQPLLDEALKALVEAHDGGTIIRRGSARGASSHADQAKAIIAYEILDFDPGDRDAKKQAMSQAWALVETLLGRGLLIEGDQQRDARGNVFVPILPTDAARDRLKELEAAEGPF